MLLTITKDPLIQEVLAHCPAPVADQALIRHVGPGEMILTQGEAPPFFGMLITGHLKAYHTSSLGDRCLVMIHHPGDVMGEIEIIDGRPCICSVEALQSAALLCLPRDLYLQWLREDPSFHMFIHKKLCDKVYLMAKKSAEGILFPLKYRFLNLVKYLLESAAPGQTALRVQKEFLGEELGVTLRSVNRVIRELKAKGILDYQRGYLHLISRPLFDKEINPF